MPLDSFPHRGAVVVVSLCLLGVLLAGVSAADQPVVDGDAPLEIVPAENTSAYLQPAGTDGPRQTVVRQSVDVGTAVQSGATRLEGRLERLAVQRRFEAADGDGLSVLREEADILERRTANVSDAHLETRRGFSNGTLSTAEFVRRLAILQVVAERDESIRQLLEGRGARLRTGEAAETVTGLRNLEVDIETVSGPVARHLRQRLTGDLSPGVTVASVTDDGLVLATIADDQFHREALDATQRSAGGTNRFASGDVDEISAAIGRAAELYPWAFANGGGSASLEGFGDTAIYRISVTHTQGELQTYLDGVTENAFGETQRKTVAAVPTSTIRTVREGGFEVVLNGTHATGPLEVTVRRAATGTGVDADVSIDETPVGSTDDDGRLWTVQPAGQFTVNATTSSGTTVDVTVAG